MDSKKSWRERDKWLEMVGVSTDDLLNGSYYIEKLKYPPWDKRNNGKSDQDTELNNKIGYGKYAQKSYEWVKKNDSRYFDWMCENINKFRIEAEKLQLID
jgi:hypothetical protein